LKLGNIALNATALHLASRAPGADLKRRSPGVPMQVLTDRQEAGRLLAEKLVSYAGRDDAIVLGLPRGGVVVAFEIAKSLNLPLDILLVRKLGAPGQEELAMGAIASGGFRSMNQDIVASFGLSKNQIERVIAREQAELERRELTYRQGKEPGALTGKTVIVVDDGLATGASMRTALRAVTSQKPAAVVLAVPVAPVATCEGLRAEVDEAVCLMTPSMFFSIGEWYQDFRQVSDEEVVQLLQDAASFGGERGT
jgi:putative phosphoribosyl transferase